MIYQLKQTSPHSPPLTSPHLTSPLTWWYWLKGFVNPINPKLRKVSAFYTVLIHSPVQLPSYKFLLNTLIHIAILRGNKLYRR